MASTGTGLKRSSRVVETCVDCRRRIQESALQVAPLVPYIDEKIQEALHDKLLSAPPWTLEETLNVPYCDQAGNKNEEDDDLPTNCSVCAPYLRHCGAAYAGFSDVEAYVTHLAHLREEEAKKVRKVPVIIVDEDAAQEMPLHEAAGSESQVYSPVTPDQGLVDHMKLVSQLQSVRGRKVINKLLHTDPTAIGCLQGVGAVLEQREASAKMSLKDAEARVLKLQEALQSEERELQELRKALDSVDDARTRKIPNGFLSGAAPKSASTLAAPKSEPTFLQILTANPPIDAQTPTQLAHFRKMLITAKTPSYDEPPEAYAKWLQFHENRLVKGVPLHGSDWAVDLRDVRGRNAVLSRVPPAASGTREQRRYYAECLLAVLRVLSIPGEYASILQRTGIGIAGELDLSCRFAPQGSQYSPPTEVDVVELLAGQGLTVQAADDAWQFCHKFLEAHATAGESIFGPGVAESLLTRVNEKSWNHQRRVDEDEEQDSDDGSEDGEADSVSDDSGSDGGEDEDEDDDEDLAEDKDLVEHMNSLLKLHCLNGRIRTNYLFKTDRAALGRAQDNIAELHRINSVLDEKRGKVQAEAARLEQQLRDIQAEKARLRNDLEQLDPNAPRKRLIVHDGLADDLVKVEHPENPSSVSYESQTRHEKTFAVESVEDIATQIQANRRSIAGVPANGPDRTVDLRDVRGYLALRSLTNLGRQNRSKSVRDRHRKRFFAVLSIIAIPGEYAQRIHSLSAQVAAVELSPCAFGSKLDQDTVVRRLAEHGLTIELANDCWQFCYKFLEAEITNPESFYDKKFLVDLRARADAMVAERGRPSGLPIGE
ncbi:hypothetical protein B0H11DRAFT_2226930 [Mycena galericulata]|nr:hypothetical protein B0H11DRAFT_2226930 [Mycena galericulata]